MLWSWISLATTGARSGWSASTIGNSVASSLA